MQMLKNGIGRSLAGALLLSVLTACGGGGGGGSSSGGGSSGGGGSSSGGGISSSSGGGSGLSMSLSTNQVSVSAATTGAAPTATVQINLNEAPTSTVYVGYNDTTNGISSLSFSQVSAQAEAVNIAFKSPAQLGAGTYTDTINLAVCYDQQCNSQVANSPQAVQVQYTVTGGSGSSSGGSSSGGSSSGGSSSGGGSSGAATLALNSVSPGNVTAGGAAFTLTAIGTGFNTGSAVQWNGSALTTTYVSSTQLTAQVPASDIAAVGSASVTVVNASAPTGTSAAQTVKITAASVDATSFLINPAHTGAITFSSVTFPAAATWSVTLDGPPSYALIANGLVYVTVNASGTSELVALNSATGAKVWGPIAISGSANAAYDNGMVFVVSDIIGQAALMQAFDASTGTQKWSTALSGQYDFSSAPTALDGMVYTDGAGSGGTLYALNESNGALAWTEAVNNGDDSTPAVTADGVYVVFPCWTYDFNPATGGSVWTSDTGCDGGGGGTPVVANGTLYAPNGAGGSYSGQTFNAETGAAVGSYSATNPPALTSSTGYFLQSGTLRGITLSSNTILWSFAGDGALVTSPIAVNQYVIVGSSNGNLYALNGSTGQQVWTQKLSAAIPSGAGWGAGIPLSALAAGDGLLVVPAGKTLTAYTLTTSP